MIRTYMSIVTSITHTITKVGVHIFFTLYKYPQAIYMYLTISETGRCTKMKLGEVIEPPNDNCKHPSQYRSSICTCSRKMYMDETDHVIFY